MRQAEEKASVCNHRGLMVTEDESVIGLLTASRIGELMALEAASPHTGTAASSVRRVTNR